MNAPTPPAIMSFNPPTTASSSSLQPSSASTTPAPPPGSDLRQKVISILSATANGCLNELGHQKLTDRLAAVEHAYASLNHASATLRAENARLTQLLADADGRAAFLRLPQHAQAARNAELVAYARQLEARLSELQLQSSREREPPPPPPAASGKPVPASEYTALYQRYQMLLCHLSQQRRASTDAANSSGVVSQATHVDRRRASESAVSGWSLAPEENIKRDSNFRGAIAPHQMAVSVQNQPNIPYGVPAPAEMRGLPQKGQSPSSSMPPLPHPNQNLPSTAQHHRSRGSASSSQPIIHYSNQNPPPSHPSSRRTSSSSPAVIAPSSSHYPIVYNAQHAGKDLPAPAPPPASNYLPTPASRLLDPVGVSTSLGVRKQRTHAPASGSHQISPPQCIQLVPFIPSQQPQRQQRPPVQPVSHPPPLATHASQPNLNSPTYMSLQSPGDIAVPMHYNQFVHPGGPAPMIQTHVAVSGSSDPNALPESSVSDVESDALRSATVPADASRADRATPHEALTPMSTMNPLPIAADVGTPGVHLVGHDGVEWDEHEHGEDAPEQKPSMGMDIDVTSTQVEDEARCDVDMKGVAADRPDSEADEDEDEDRDWGDLTDDESDGRRPVAECVSAVFFDDEDEERYCRLCKLRADMQLTDSVVSTFSESSMKELVLHLKEEHPVAWERLRSREDQQTQMDHD